MIVAIDTNAMVAWFSQKEKDRDDRFRLDNLLAVISRASGRLVLPTPCLAEFLVGVDDSAMDWLSVLERRRSIIIAPFDRRSAFECSLIDKAAIGAGDKRAGRTDAWQKIKVDRQVVSIARANNASMLITTDEGLRSTALSCGLLVRRLNELELPDSARQQNLALSDEADAQN